MVSKAQRRFNNQKDKIEIQTLRNLVMLIDRKLERVFFAKERMNQRLSIVERSLQELRAINHCCSNCRISNMGQKRKPEWLMNCHGEAMLIMKLKVTEKLPELGGVKKINWWLQTVSRTLQQSGVPQQEWVSLATERLISRPLDWYKKARTILGLKSWQTFSSQLVQWGIREKEKTKQPNRNVNRECFCCGTPLTFDVATETQQMKKMEVAKKVEGKIPSFAPGGFFSSLIAKSSPDIPGTSLAPESSLTPGTNLTPETSRVPDFKSILSSPATVQQGLAPDPPKPTFISSYVFQVPKSERFTGLFNNTSTDNLCSKSSGTTHDLEDCVQSLIKELDADVVSNPVDDKQKPNTPT